MLLLAFDADDGDSNPCPVTAVRTFSIPTATSTCSATPPRISGKPASSPAWRALAYVERNSVRAALSKTADRFPWSSAPFRLGHAAPPAWLNLSEWSRHWNAGDWTGLLQESTGEPAFGEKFHTN